MYFLLITLFLFIYASTIASSKQLIVVENNETRVSLESNIPSILTIETHQFKRSLYSSVQVLDLGDYALLKHNLLSQISRYKALKVFHVHNSFFSRKDLSAEYFFLPEKIPFTQCKQLCLSKDASLIHSVQHLLDLQKYIPRSTEFFWVDTQQEAWSVSKYRAKYKIFFDNINLDNIPNNIQTKRPKYFFLTHNYTLTEFSKNDLGPMLKYYDNLRDSYWVKSFPELQVQMNISKDVNVIYPPPSLSLKTTQLSSNCICARSLRNNFFKLKNAQKIVHDAESILKQLPLHLETKRIKNDHISTNISILDILQSNISQKGSILNPNRLKQIILNNSDQNQAENYDIKYLKSIIHYLSFFENIPSNLSKIENKQLTSPLHLKYGKDIELQRRQKRMPIKLLKKFPLTKIFSKIIKIGSSYLLQNFQPFQEFQEIFHQYFDIFK